MNLFGVDVRALDVEAFLAAARHAFPLLAVAWLVLVVRLRRPGLLLLGVLFANAYVWLETNWPLQRLYALGPSSDRVNNLALCQVVAAGHSPLHTPQVGQMHFEPFWAVVTAIVSGWSPSRLLVLYSFFPLVTACGFALSLFFALRPQGSPVEAISEEPAWSGWERALIALFATLLSSTALDYAGPYRVPWAMTFLLKPNHALGLVLFPWVLRAFVGISRGRDRVVSGFLLHVLGWAFVIHMGEVCVGLVSFALLATLTRREDARCDWLDVTVVIGINLLVVSPYLIMLFRGFGVLDAGPRLQIPPNSPHLLEALTRTAGLSALAAWGVVIAWRRDRMGRVWASQALGALLVWLAYYPLSLLQQAKERDDTYYWLRIHIAVCAAIGTWDLARRLALRLDLHALRPPLARAALVAAAALPFTIPYWWNPARMDLYFARSLEPLPVELTGPAAFLRANASRDAVLAGDVTAARWMSALAGSPVILARDLAAPHDYEARVQLNEALMRGGPGDPRVAAARYGVAYLLVTPAFVSDLGLSLEEVENRPYLRRVHFDGDPRGEYLAVFAVSPPPS
ncbi:MAG TPA: hypothetical protein VFT38_03600 [Vicinamibacteria bacterium]|nr:hypothetical protein [Vicinamibacteria bacterium]